MSTLAIKIQFPRQVPQQNDEIILAVDRMAHRGFLVSEIYLSPRQIDLTLSLETDGPIHDEDDAHRAVMDALGNIDYDGMEILHGEVDYDTEPKDDTLTCGLNCMSGKLQPLF